MKNTAMLYMQFQGYLSTPLVAELRMLTICCASIGGMIVAPLSIGNSGARWRARQHQRPGLPAVLPLHRAHVRMARHRHVRRAVRAWGPAGAGVGRRAALRLGVPHHLVCQQRQPRLGLPVVRHWRSEVRPCVGAGISAGRAVRTRLRRMCVPSTGLLNSASHVRDKICAMAVVTAERNDKGLFLDATFFLHCCMGSCMYSMSLTLAVAMCVQPEQLVGGGACVWGRLAQQPPCL